MEKLNLLLLPGLLNDASLFEVQAAALADVGTITIADLTRSDTIGGLADSVLSEAPDGRFVLVGFSMGGYVAFEILRKAAGRVCGLVLMDTSARPDTEEARAGREELIQRSESDFPGVIEALLARMAHPDDANTPEVGGVLQSMASALGRDVFVTQQRAIMSRPDSRPLLREIRCPTLIICGRDDQITPPAVHDEMAAGIVGSRLEIIDDCGHLAPLEQPERVTELLRDWLTKLPA